MSVLTFQHLLQAAQVPLERTKLIRHKDSQLRGPETPYHKWRRNLAEFEDYQKYQKPQKSFKPGLNVGSFVCTPAGETLFVGLYYCRDRVPFMYDDGREDFLHDLERSSALSEYSGRVVIDWGKGALAYVQWAYHNPKPLLELRRSFQEPTFPGYGNFQIRLEDVPSLYETWAAILRQARGIYLLVCNRTGEQYVGSAIGSDGFLGRWIAYAMDGHGGNVLLRPRGHRDYTVSILEVAGSAAAAEDILSREALWKSKLGSRAHGLNAN